MDIADLSLFARPAIVYAGSTSPVDIDFHDGGCSDGYGLGPAIEGGAGLRLGAARRAELGVLGGYRAIGASPDCLDNSHARTAFWLGPYGRVTFALDVVDVFASAALAFVDEHRSWDASFSGAGRAPSTLAHYGLGLELSGGVLARLGPFAAGPFVAVTPIAPLGSSFAPGVSGVDAPTSASFYVTFAAGLELRATFGGAPR